MTEQDDDAKVSFVTTQAVLLAKGIIRHLDQAALVVRAVGARYRGFRRARTGVYRHLHTFHASQPPAALGSDSWSLSRAVMAPAGGYGPGVSDSGPPVHPFDRAREGQVMLKALARVLDGRG